MRVFGEPDLIASSSSSSPLSSLRLRFRSRTHLLPRVRGCPSAVPSHQQRSAGHGEKMPNVFDRRSPSTGRLTSPTDHFDIVSHVEGAFPPCPFLAAPMTMERRNMTLNVLWPPFAGISGVPQHRRRRDRSSGTSLWLCKCPGLSVGQLLQTSKVPEVTLAPSAVSCNLHGPTRRHVFARQSLNSQRLMPLQDLTLSSRVCGPSPGFHLPA